MLHKDTEGKDLRYINSMVLNMHHKTYEDNTPTVEDGFDRVDMVEFKPMKFNDQESDKLFRQYLC